MAAAFVAFNAALFYPGVAAGFVGMVFGSGTSTPFYTPAWIPIVLIACLMALNAGQMVDVLKKNLAALKNRGVSVH